MKLLLDTNRYSDLVKGLPEAIDMIGRASEVCIPFVVLAELYTGFRAGNRRPDNERLLNKFLSRFSVRILWPDDRTINLVADITVQLRKQGTPIPSHDIWIAALALQHGLTLYARDKHFDHLPQVARA